MSDVDIALHRRHGNTLAAAAAAAVKPLQCSNISHSLPAADQVCSVFNRHQIHSKAVHNGRNTAALRT